MTVPRFVLRLPRSFPSALPALVLGTAFAATSLAPRVALADGTSAVRSATADAVASIAAKGTVSPAVPVEGGLGLGLVAGLFAFGWQRRARR